MHFKSIETPGTPLKPSENPIEQLWNAFAFETPWNAVESLWNSLKHSWNAYKDISVELAYMLKYTLMKT